jgi:hypothetical protein
MFLCILGVRVIVIHMIKLILSPLKINLLSPIILI